MAAGKILVFIVLVVAGGCAAVNFDDMKKGMDAKKMTEMFDCLEYIVCKKGKDSF